MPRHITLNIEPDDWTELTAGNVDRITFHNRVGRSMLVQITTGAKPTSDDGALEYEHMRGELNILLADLSPGVEGGTRVWAKAEKFGGPVAVSHA